MRLGHALHPKVVANESYTATKNKQCIIFNHENCHPGVWGSKSGWMNGRALCDLQLSQGTYRSYNIATIFSGVGNPVPHLSLPSTRPQSILMFLSITPTYRHTEIMRSSTLKDENINRVRRSFVNVLEETSFPLRFKRVSHRQTSSSGDQGTCDHQSECLVPDPGHPVVPARNGSRRFTLSDTQTFVEFKFQLAGEYSTRM